ncbi:MAG: hypothetical protein C0410_11745 [Anaerolinea sp.]|nr:hypothetical protein [Anaerolinea sp.]
MKKHLFLCRPILYIVLIAMLIISSCNFPIGGVVEDQSEIITQTFAAVNLSIAQTQTAVQYAEMLSVTPEPILEVTVTPQPTNTEEPTATIEHMVFPGEPPGGIHSSMRDADSSATAGEQRARAGELFNVNLFERPFTANDMVYYPDLDIQKAVLNQTSDWIYVVISLKGPSPENGMRGFYGLEVDLNSDGRGDVLIMAGQPGSTWSTDRVKVWQDTNKDVGSRTPLTADNPKTGDGYDKLVFDQGLSSDADLAWARRSPSDSNDVQIAFKPSTINNDTGYLWGAWTDLGVMEPSSFDYNDRFTHAEAGSPLKEIAQHYPLKALALVDNTCRWSFGFTPKGNEPGICPIPATPTPTSTSTPTVTSTPVPIPSNITGIVYGDGNGTLTYDSGEFPFSGAVVHLYSGGCGSGGGEIASTTTGADGRYNFGGLFAGTYCVDVNPAPASFTVRTPATTVIIGEPKTHIANFGYFYLG